MLSTMLWANAANGDWDVAANWVNQSNPADNHVPIASDDAIINQSGITVTHSQSNADSVNSVTVVSSSTSIDISSGTLTIAATSNVAGGLTLSGGNLSGSGTVNVSGATTWNGGTMSGTGTTVADGGLSIGVAGAYRQMFLDGRTLENFGPATLSEADQNCSYGLFLSSGATFDNEAGASFAFATDAEIIDQGGTPDGGTFVNAGTLSKTGGTGTSSINSGITLNDTGTVQVSTGTLSLQGGGTIGSAATLTADSGADLDFGGGTFTAPAGSSITGVGTGSVSFSGGTVTASGTYNVTGSTIADGGTANLTAPITAVGSNVTVTGGTLNLSGGGPALTTTTLNLSGGTLTGIDTLTVAGQTTWSGGTMSGTGVTDAQGGLTLGAAGASDQESLSGRALNNFAAATLAGANSSYGLRLDLGATFDNKPGASFNFTTDARIDAGGGTPAGGTFNNEGTLSKTGGTDTSIIAVPLNTTGPVQVASGTLSLQGGGTISSAVTLNAATGTTLDFGAGTYTIPAGASITGTGSVSFENATVTINGTYSVAGTTTVNYGAEVDFNTATTIPTLTLNNGTIDGSGTLTVTGATTWTGGTMSGPGVTNAQGGLTLTLNADGQNTVEYLSGRILNNFAAATLAGGNLDLDSGATFDNKPGASVSFTTDASIRAKGGTPAGGTFSNEGTLSKTGGPAPARSACR